LKFHAKRALQRCSERDNKIKKDIKKGAGSYRCFQGKPARYRDRGGQNHCAKEKMDCSKGENEPAVMSTEYQEQMKANAG